MTEITTVATSVNTAFIKSQCNIKTKNKTTEMPTYKTFEECFINYKYTVPQLKKIAKYNKLKVSGNKNEVQIRIYDYFNNSIYTIKIQALFRGFIVRKYLNMFGPALKKPELCVNSTDFLTLDNLTDISLNYLFTYKDEKEYIYGFHLSSIYNLIFKKGKGMLSPIENPYNREKFPDEVFKSIKNILRYQKLLNLKINLKIDNPDDEKMEISLEKQNEFKALEIFQTINRLGNYSNFQWFLSLSKQATIFFIIELRIISVIEFLRKTSN
jgi:hypothetical protein